MEGLGIKYVFGKPLKGWLRQHIGKMRGWQCRYFVLDSGRLSCLTREDDVLAIKTYLLKDCELKEFPKSTDSTFELISDKGTGESVVFRAASEEERREWVKALRYVIYGDTGGGVFGVPLAELMKYECKEGRSVPYIVEACINHLKENATETEGIFRLPGRAGLVKELRGKFDNGYRPVMDSVDVHTVASLLKTYLRDLPESLVPPSFYQRAMNFSLRYSEANSDELRMKELTGLAELLKELPSDSYTTLAYICQFLNDLTASSEKTKMDSHNLSLVFGPNLIRHLDDNPELMMVTTDLTQHLAYMLIHHCQSVFPPVSSQKASEAEDNTGQDNIPTADLLNLSAFSEGETGRSKSATRPKALGNLMDLDLNMLHGEMFADQSTASATSPFVVITDPFGACSLETADKKDSASSETSGGIGSVDTGSAKASGVGAKPIPPKRNKTKSLKRNQQLSEYFGSTALKSDASSQLTTQNAETSPTVLDSAQRLTEKGKADESVAKDNLYKVEITRIVNATYDKQLVTSDCQPAVNKDEKKEIKNSEDCLFPTDNCSDLARGAAINNTVTVGVDAVKLPPSRTLLEAQVSALKTELVSVKSQYDYQVSSLKSELNSLRSMFDDRITSLEKEHANRMKDLTTRLAVERKARAEAVDMTVNLQAELYRYKLQYGEIHEAN
ncbi:hypothetical protein ACOMHN_012962 [Nucella lapillus]